MKYIDEFRIMTLIPGIRELKAKTANKLVLEVIFENLRRQFEMWQNTSSYAPLRTSIFSDPGLSEQEGEEVYTKLDRVFREVFPTQAHLDRPLAAGYANRLVRDVYNEMVKSRLSHPGTRQHLLLFMERLLVVFENHHAPPLDCIEA